MVIVTTYHLFPLTAQISFFAGIHAAQAQSIADKTRAEQAYACPKKPDHIPTKAPTVMTMFY